MKLTLASLFIATAASALFALALVAAPVGALPVAVSGQTASSLPRSTSTSRSTSRSAEARVAVLPPGEERERERERDVAAAIDSSAAARGDSDESAPIGRREHAAITASSSEMTGSGEVARRKDKHASKHADADKHANNESTLKSKSTTISAHKSSMSKLAPAKDNSQSDFSFWSGGGLMDWSHDRRRGGATARDAAPASPDDDDDVGRFSWHRGGGGSKDTPPLGVGDMTHRREAEAKQREDAEKRFTWGDLVWYGGGGGIIDKITTRGDAQGRDEDEDEAKHKHKVDFSWGNPWRHLVGGVAPRGGQKGGEEVAQ